MSKNIIIIINRVILMIMTHYILIQLTVNGRNSANGVSVHKHVKEANNHVQDPSRRKQKMVEIPVLGMQLRPNPAIQTRV